MPLEKCYELFFERFDTQIFEFGFSNFYLCFFEYHDAYVLGHKASR